MNPNPDPARMYRHVTKRRDGDRRAKLRQEPRTCSKPGCYTILSRYNLADDLCFAHRPKRRPNQPFTNPYTEPT